MLLLEQLDLPKIPSYALGSCTTKMFPPSAALGSSRSQRDWLEGDICCSQAAFFSRGVLQVARQPRGQR